MDDIPAAERLRRTPSSRAEGRGMRPALKRHEKKCVYRRSTFSSMRNADSESDAESDADTECRC